MGLFKKWRERRQENKAARQERRLERMQVRNEIVAIRGKSGGGIGGAVSSIAKALTGGGDPSQNSPVTRSGSAESTTIITEDMQANMMKYLPYVLGGLVLYFVMKKGR